MNLRTMDPGGASSGTSNPLDTTSVHGCINMVNYKNVVMLSKDYGTSQPDLGKEPAPLESPLHIGNPMDKPNIAPRIPKGVLKHSGHNPNSRATQNYSVFEDLGQTPCAMSAFEVLESCPPQRKALLSSLGINDDNSSSVIKFETMGIQPRLPYYVYFFIHVECLNMTVIFM